MHISLLGACKILLVSWYCEVMDRAGFRGLVTGVAPFGVPNGISQLLVHSRPCHQKTAIQDTCMRCILHLQRASLLLARAIKNIVQFCSVWQVLRLANLCSRSLPITAGRAFR